jgi:glycine oxidase
VITSECIIIGGGIMGLLSARELASHGYKTTVIDSDSPGHQCSWAGGGILSPLYPWQMPGALQALSAWSQRQYPVLVESLRESTGIDPELWQCGMLIHATDDLAVAADWAKRKNIIHAVVDEAQVAKIAPALARQPAPWFWMPELTQVRNPRLLSALKFSLQKSGVQFFDHTEVRSIVVNQHQAEGVETSRGPFSAPVIVIAGGAWTSRLWPAITVRPVRGQMLCYQTERNFLQTMVLKEGKYAVPRRDGLVLVGSTTEDVGFDAGTSIEARNLLAAAAADMLPGINRFPVVGHWSGLRPATPSGLPCIGAWPETEGLFLNTGHYRNGVLLAPASARLLADIILQRETPFPADAFQPVVNRDTG